MSCPLSVHLLFLGGLLQTCSLLCVAKEYYVTPTQPSNFTCPTGKPCHTLDAYANKSSWLFRGETEVSLLFGDGTHYFTRRDWTISNIENFTMAGLNPSSILVSSNTNVICNNCGIEFSNITTLKMEYLSFTTATFHLWMFVSMHEVQNVIQNHMLTRRWVYTISSGNVSFDHETRNSVHHTMAFSVSSRTVASSVSIQDSMFTNGSNFYVTPVRNGFPPLTFLLRNISYHSNSGYRFGYKMNVFQFLHNLTIDNCYFEGNEGNPSFFLIIYSNVYFKGNTTFANNNGVQGGAMTLFSSYLYLEKDSNITFINNSATDIGGAIYFFNESILINKYFSQKCFYQIRSLTRANTTVFFINNTATNGGDDIYGTSLKSSCLVNNNVHSYEIQEEMFHFSDKSGHDLSQVASNPERVCLCDENGRPQCASYSYLVQHRTLTPGEKFNLSVAVVGGDFGTVTDAVYAIIKDPSSYFIGSGKIIAQFISSPVCTALEYSVYSTKNSLSLFIGINSGPRTIDNSSLIASIKEYRKFHNINDRQLRYIPVQIKIDIQACPMGMEENNISYTCECNSTLTDHGLDHCIVNNSKGLVYRNETTWIGLSKTNDFTELLFSDDCPYDYCKTDNIPVDLNDSDFQCELGHVGILCGSCPSDLSLALGSSRCINCTNNGRIALVLGFVVAGPALVFLIKILDLTVSWGTINGLILYANIIWINRNILFLSKDVIARSLSHNYLSHSGIDNSSKELMANRFADGLTTFKVFIAWLNLDFRIESCFFQGMNAYWKTWLQFVFPLYLWIIVLTIIVLCHYSSKLTKVFGNNIVSVLATLFLMSYIKLLRTIVTVLGYAYLYKQDGTRYVMWLFDGTVPYFGWPHSILFVTALLFLTVLIIPYTLTLLCVPYLKRKSDYYLLRWINKFKPIFDVYYGPLKDKYHYWIGVTLLIRVFLALLNDTSQNIPSNIILATTASISAVMSMLVTHVYKSVYLSALESSFIINLTLLCVSFLTTSSHESRTILMCVSIGVSFLTFLVIVTFHVKVKIKKCCKSNSQQDLETLNEQREHDVTMATYGACNNTILESDGLREPLLESLRIS